jgi:hypothetical protein
MGLLKRLFGGGDETMRRTEREKDEASRPQVEIAYSQSGEDDLVQLTGTTTFAKEGIAALASRMRSPKMAISRRMAFFSVSRKMKLIRSLWLFM